MGEAVQAIKIELSTHFDATDALEELKAVRPRVENAFVTIAELLELLRKQQPAAPPETSASSQSFAAAPASAAIVIAPSLAPPAPAKWVRRGGKPAKECTDLEFFGPLPNKDEKLLSRERSPEEPLQPKYARTREGDYGIDMLACA